MMLVFALCVVTSFLCQIFKVNAVVNVIYAFSLLLVFACYFLSGHINGIVGTLIILLGFATIIRGVIYESDYWTHLLITVCIFICIDVSESVRISRKTFDRILHLFFITVVILLVAYYIGPLKSSYFKWTDVICLNFPNPNAAGLWLACFFILLFYSAFLYRRGKKVSLIISSVALLPIIVATEARNSFLACIFFMLCMILARIFKVKRVPNFVLAVFACLPIIVWFFYMFVIVKNMAFWENLFSDYGFNKSIDAREGIWSGLLENFWDCFWIGDYYKYYDSQQHNSLMTIYARFGAPATVLVCILLYRTLKKLQDNASFYATVSLSALLFTGCFEASIFVGIAGMYLMLLLIPVCAAVQEDEDEQELGPEPELKPMMRGKYW